LRRKRTMRIVVYSNTNSDSSVGSGNTSRTAVNARDVRKSIKWIKKKLKSMIRPDIGA
jgi:hypothetical protein